MKRLELLLIFLLGITFANAQIGYQVSLLNTATGEPRANEKVTAKIELSNSDGEVVYSETQTGVTNDFGVLSLTIGNAQSLSAIDWSKYPMFISVTVDNVLIGKTQVMSVPYANAIVPLNKDTLIGTWSGSMIELEHELNYTFIFHLNGAVDFYQNEDLVHGFYTIQGNVIYCILSMPADKWYSAAYKLVTILYIDGALYFSPIYEGRSPKLTKQ